MMLSENLYNNTLEDYDTYFQYATKKLASLTISNNHSSTGSACARFLCEANTTYHISMWMDNRFRIASYETPNTNPCSNYWIDELDVNDATHINQTRTHDFTTGNKDTVIIIFYWTSTSTASYTAIKETIKITKDVADQVQPDKPIQTIKYIYDRTQADVDNKTDKGFLSYTDLNRIESNMQEIKGYLMQYGYDTQAVTASVIKNWSLGDALTRTDADVIRNNITAYITAFHKLGEMQDIVSNNTFDYNQVNILEKDLEQLNLYIERMALAFDYAGVFYCG